jgi:hypothetical protein
MIWLALRRKKNDIKSFSCRRNQASSKRKWFSTWFLKSKNAFPSFLSSRNDESTTFGKQFLEQRIIGYLYPFVKCYRLSLQFIKSLLYFHYLDNSREKSEEGFEKTSVFSFFFSFSQFNNLWPLKKSKQLSN